MAPQETPPQTLPLPPVQIIERRASVRYASLREATCLQLPSGGDRVCSAHVWDLSVAGVSMVVDRCLESGTILVIALESAPENVTRPLQARVVHVAPHLDHLWFIGCEFIKPLADEELRDLL